MNQSSSSGPVDPFGPCPVNPKTENQIKNEAVVRAAKELHDYLRNNVGETADFPVGIVVREPAEVQEAQVTKLLNNLQQAIKEFDEA